MAAMGRSLGDSEYNGRTLKDGRRGTWSDSHVWRLDWKKVWVEVRKLVGSLGVCKGERRREVEGGGMKDLGICFGKGLTVCRWRACGGQEKGLTN